MALTIMAAIVVGPATFRALRWGHPEDLLGAALAVAAVLAASHRRPVTAGVLLGLAIATKQWGVFALLPVLMLARGQRRRVASVAGIVASAFIVPMLVGDPPRFFDQNLNTAVVQLGVTQTNIWWPFHHLAFDPTINQEIEVLPSALRTLSHPLAVALVLGLSVLYWRRSAARHPYDALQLLALFFLIRCLLDPLTISYHHAPFVLTIAMFEGLRCRRVPVVTLTSTAALLVLGNLIAPLIKPNLMYAVYLLWVLPTIAYLIMYSFGGQPRLVASTHLLEQPPLARPAASG
jgi:Gpi18-like mannosyltransferase